MEVLNLEYCNDDGNWRVENTEPKGMYDTHHVYEGDRYVCACSPGDALRIVEAMNRHPAASNTPNKQGRPIG